MIQQAIGKAVQRIDLTETEMIQAVEIIADGQATEAQIGAFLAALRMKGETVGEIAGAARVMRARSSKIPVKGRNENDVILDTCGTGGDGSNTFNVSTTAAFVAAGAGIKTAKHGNRSVSSKCGSADVMEALGVNLDLSPEQVGVCIDEVGIGFLFAPRLHSAMKHVIGPRRELAVRTVFNVLGPLTNPAGADVQVMGVYDPALTETLAHVLGHLGTRNAMIVHGEDGCDEISITGPTRISHLSNGNVKTYTLTPEDAGLENCSADEIRGGAVARNAAITVSVLQGEKGSCRDMVLLNAAAALVVSGKATDFREGVSLAAEVIDSGLALSKLRRLASLSEKLAVAGTAFKAAG